jgi:purine-binding chemotaxis protein CheW
MSNKTPGKPRTPIDWQKVRERMSRAAAPLTDGQRTSPERIRAVLEERARAAARIPTAAPDAGAVIEIVRFDLGCEHYALETQFLREILPSKECTPLPGAPDFLAGIINLRGQILAVMDLRRLFNIARPADMATSRIIVLGQERMEFGVVADAVHDVLLLRLDALRSAPDSVSGIAHEYLRGVTADALIVLDGAVLLKDPRLIVDVEE